MAPSMQETVSIIATDRNRRCAAPLLWKAMKPVEAAIPAITALIHPGEPEPAIQRNDQRQVRHDVKAMKRAVRARRTSTAFIVGFLVVGGETAEQAVEAQNQPSAGVIEPRRQSQDRWKPR